jgi:predicted alpha/beta hydrolase
MMGVFAPVVLATRGHMPGALMGGEDMPAAAFEEWRRWCLDPDFLFGDDTLPERRNVARFTAPIRFLQFADDPWGTPASVGDMAQRFHASRDRRVVAVDPREAGAQRIGHMGFFRAEFKETLWRPHLDWLLAPADVPSVPASA